MSDDIRTGFIEAVTGVLTGIVLTVILRIIPTLPSIPSEYVGIFQLVEVLSLVGSIVVISTFESWGFWYLIGWLFGMWIMLISRLVENWLFTIYLVVGVVILIAKGLQKLRSFSF